MIGRVVHLRKEPYDERIDRATVWGNPFVIGRDGDRTEVIAKYKNWVLTSTDPSAVWIREHVDELYGKVLGCWCAPQQCHGSVLIDLAELEHLT